MTGASGARGNTAVPDMVGAAELSGACVDAKEFEAGAVADIAAAPDAAGAADATAAGCADAAAAGAVGTATAACVACAVDAVGSDPCDAAGTPEG